jgi:hypothetical protein
MAHGLRVLDATMVSLVAGSIARGGMSLVSGKDTATGLQKIENL